MDKIKSFFTHIKPQKDCDLTDRVTYYYTVLILTIFSFIIFGWSLFGTPIQCWFPAQYKGWWAEYALDYCYVQNTYFVKFHTGQPQNHWELDSKRVELPTDHDERQKLTIGYYQWVPFVLALMAISFYVPVAFWRAMYGHSGISVKTLCDQAGSSETLKSDARKAVAGKMALYLDHSKRVRERFRGNPISGRYLIVLYLFTKLLTVCICVGQFFMLEQFLGLENSWWGVSVLNDITHGREWTETGNFPRVTQCDYKVRELGAIHHHTVQCVLLINMLNEKMFVFLWFWFLITAVLACISLAFWLFYALFPSQGRRYVASFLNHLDPKLGKSQRMRKLVNSFMNETLKPDGIFLLRLIGHNSGDLICSDLIEAMWSDYKKRHEDDFPMPETLGPQPVKLADLDNEKGFHDQPTAPRYVSQLPPLPSYDDVDKLKPRLRTTNM